MSFKTDFDKGRVISYPMLLAIFKSELLFYFLLFLSISFFVCLFVFVQQMTLNF